MPSDILEALARRLEISRDRILPVCEFLDSGLAPVFIAHYRRASTSGMDEPTIRRLVHERRRLQALEELRQRAAQTIEQAAAADPTGRIAATTQDLTQRLAEAEDAESIEDLVRPLRPRRRTAGLVARERGLGPLADYAAAGLADGPDLPVKAAEFVNPDNEIRSPEEALAGAGHILADQVAEDARIRQAVRRIVWERGILKTRQAKEGAKHAAEFRGYFQFQEPIGHLPPHRIMAINRGERSKALKTAIEVPPDAIQAEALPLVARDDHRFRAFLECAVADALQRLVLPAVERDVRRQLTEQAEAHAIEVFAANLKSLLMARPIGPKRVLAIQPGYRTGTKTAAIDAEGALLGETIIYPLEPQKKWVEGKAALLAEIRRHQVEVISIGNGTGCREIEQLVSEVIEENNLEPMYTIISEAGAAVYADSEVAREEFPNLDAAIRATVSIGRRLQDPLAEFVKIDPRAIGVGLYQHDVNQPRLRQALDETMESCVGAVGADANAASPAMLRRIAGLTEEHVATLVARRKALALGSREAVRSLPGWDERTFLQAAGFLRVHGANPLDATRVHPENYAAAERLITHLGHKPADLADPAAGKSLRQHLTGLALEPLAAELGLSLAVLVDIVGALQHPDQDPRTQHHGPIFRKKMRRIEDLQPGMWVKGVVRNVVDFGAFVDIGLKEDGLVHISQFSKRYVRNPLKFLHVGDVVDVRIVSIEADKHRIALTLIQEQPARKAEPRAAGRQAPAARAAAAPEARAAAATASAQQAPAASPAASLAAQAHAQPRAGRPPRRTQPARDQRHPAHPAAADLRPPAAAKPDRRPAAASPQGARADGPRPEKSRGPRPGRPPRDRRPPSGLPRIIVSKSKDVPESRQADPLGRPRLRWAYYDSDIDEIVREEDEQASPPAPQQPPPSEAAPSPIAGDSPLPPAVPTPDAPAQPGPSPQP